MRKKNRREKWEIVKDKARKRKHTRDMKSKQVKFMQKGGGVGRRAHAEKIIEVSRERNNF
jgi:hypothetical protein